MKIILLDLEDTITVHKTGLNRQNEVTIKWLSYNGIENPVEFMALPEYKNRQERIKKIGITEKEYEKWYCNYSDIEFEKYLEDYSKGDITIASNVENFLQNCKLPKVLVSNSSPKWIDFILDKSGLSKYFTYIWKRKYNYNDVKKPNKEIKTQIEEILEQPISSDSIMIGDSKVDADFATNINVRFITNNKSLKAFNYFNDFIELNKIIK